MCILDASHLTGASEYPVVWAMPRHPLQGESQVAASWTTYQASQVAQVVKKQPAVWENRFDPRFGKIPWRRKWQPTLVFLLGNPMDRGALWATVHGVAKSWTWLSTWTTYHGKEGPVLFELFVLKKSILKYGVRNAHCYSLLVLSVTSISHHIPICNCWICSSHINFPVGPGISSFLPQGLYTCYCVICPHVFPSVFIPVALTWLHCFITDLPDRKWVTIHNLIVHFSPLLMSFMT